MAKEENRSSRETRKPKEEKPAASIAASPFKLPARPLPTKT